MRSPSPGSTPSSPGQGDHQAGRSAYRTYDIKEHSVHSGNRDNLNPHRDRQTQEAENAYPARRPARSVADVADPADRGSNRDLPVALVDLALVSANAPDPDRS